MLFLVLNITEIYQKVNIASCPGRRHFVHPDWADSWYKEELPVFKAEPSIMHGSPSRTRTYNLAVNSHSLLKADANNIKPSCATKECNCVEPSRVLKKSLLKACQIQLLRKG